MAQGKSRPGILSDVTRVGSTLTELAASQLDQVLKDLQGSTGAADPQGEPDIGAQTVGVGTLAANATQLFSKIGDLIGEISKYDLVRRDTTPLTLGTVGPISDISIPAEKTYEYPFLLENSGIQEQEVTCTAVVTPAPEGVQIRLVGSHEPLHPGERRRYVLSLSGVPEGTYRLRIEVHNANLPEKVLARKTVRLHVLPPPRPAE